MEIISTSDLAHAVGRSANELDGDPRAIQLVRLTNGLITEKWERPVTPVPTSIQLLALAVVTRAWSSTPGQAPLQSITRSHQDSSRTERYAVSEQSAAGYGVYLEAAELAQLRGDARRRRPRTLRLGVPGVPGARTW